MRKTAWVIFAVTAGIAIVAVMQVPSFARGMAMTITLSTLGFIALTWVAVGVVGKKLGSNAQKRAMHFAQHGLDATATLTGLADTGVTINENPRVKLSLNVAVPGRPVYQVQKTETMSRLSVGMLQIGREYPCKVDPSNPNELLVSWTGQPVGPTFGSAAELIARGIPGEARIADTFDVGVTAPNGDPVTGFVLDVTVSDGRPPYQVRLGHRVPSTLGFKPRKGQTVPVKVDRDDPQQVAIDWALAMMP